MVLPPVDHSDRNKWGPKLLAWIQWLFDQAPSQAEVDDLRQDVTNAEGDIDTLQNDVGQLQTDITSKADQSDLDSLSNVVDDKADSSQVDVSLNPDGTLVPSEVEDAYVAAGGLTGAEASAVQAVTDDIDSLTLGQIIQGAVGGGRSKVKHRSHTGITIAAVDSPAWMKAMADHVCDGTDDHVQWQAAIDEAQTYLSLSGPLPTIVPMPGVYYWADTVQFKSAPVVPSSASLLPVVVRWQGDDSTTAMTKPNGYEGNQSFWDLTGIRFMWGTELQLPDIWLDLTVDATGSVGDVFFGLRWVQFIGGRVQVRVGEWVNLHWDHMRFDSWGEHAIELRPGALQNLSSFHLDKFTADNHIGAFPQYTANKSFLHVVKPTNGANYGNVKLSTARVEFNSALDGTDKGLVMITTPGVDGDGNEPGGFQLILENIDFQNAAPAVNTPVVHSKTSRTNVSQKYAFRDVKVDAVTEVFGGAWFSQFSTPQAPADGRLNWSNIPLRLLDEGNPLHFSIANLDDTNIILQTKLQDWDAGTNTFQIDSKGKHNWAAAYVAPDTNLYRSAADTLKTDDQFHAAGGITTKVKAGVPTDSDTATDEDGTILIDSSNNRIYVRVGGAWKYATLT